MKPSIMPMTAVSLGLCVLTLGISKHILAEPQATAPGQTAKPAIQPSPLTCPLTTDKTVYKIGEVPKLKIRIRNEQDKPIYLVGSLDGSAEAMRYPYCSLNIQRPKDAPELQGLGRCGNMNALRTKDFVQVAPKATFDPFVRLDDGGFFGLHPEYRAPNLFATPGEHRLSFTYSTNHTNIAHWLGDGRWANDGKPESEIETLWKQVPKTTARSGIVTIRFEK